MARKRKVSAESVQEIAPVEEIKVVFTKEKSYKCSECGNVCNSPKCIRCGGNISKEV